MPVEDTEDAPGIDSAVAAALEVLGAIGERDVQLAPLTTYRVGGAAAVFVRVRAVEDLERVACARRVSGLPILVVAGVAITVTHESAGRSWAIGFQVLDNVALVAIGIGLILRGAGAGSSQHFFLGIATILLTALIRYMDLVGDYIGGAVLFLAFAALLLGAARYWKSRQSREVEP